MSNRLEDKIRDYLADHLDLLEIGLKFVDKEYGMPNDMGAGGRIDLLARDIYGHVVVIEIKRSDQTARQALHEIHKYTALFRNSQGLDESRLRLMVVSTEWHELRLPFSEFAQATPYSVEGISITVQPDGVVTNVSKVKLLEKTAALKISRAQCIYLYQTAAKREACLQKLNAVVKAAGVQDFSIFRCDYSGKNPMVIYPFGHYLCFSSPARNLSASEFEQLKKRVEWEDGLNEPDENFVAYITGAMFDFCDTLETGYSEKLTNLRAEWSVTVSIRHGRLAQEEAILTDEEIIALAQACDGGSPIYIGKTSSPRFGASWKQLRADLEPVLRGNANWQEVVPRFLEEVETSAPTATVSVFLYNPTNFFMALYWIAWNQDYSKCPHLEIVIEDQATGLVRVLIGFLAWDGRNLHTTAKELMRNIYGDDSAWMFSVTLHATFEEEDAVLAAHHLKVRTVEWRFEAGEALGPTEVHIKKGRVCRRPFHGYRPFGEFVACHSGYLAGLKAHLEDISMGLPGKLV